MYELLAGLPPFLGDAVSEILQQMLQNQIDFSLLPDDCSPEAADLVAKLLVVDPAQRLGYAGAHELHKHPWFDDIDWQFLRQVPGPFVPRLGDAEDTDYFRNGRQENLAQCKSLLTAISGEGEEEAAMYPYGKETGLEEQEGNVFIDKFVGDEEEEEDDDGDDDKFESAKIDREGYLDRKFTVGNLGVIKNFSYKNLVRLHSRNKAQMQRHSFFKGPGGRTRFGAAPPDLVRGHHRLNGVGGA